MVRFYIQLTEDDYQKLREFAKNEYRDPRQQAGILIHNVFSQDKDNLEARVKYLEIEVEKHYTALGALGTAVFPGYDKLDSDEPPTTNEC